MLRRIAYVVLMVLVIAVLSAWGSLTPSPPFTNGDSEAPRFLAWFLSSQAIVALMTYPTGLLGFWTWWPWRAGIMTEAEAFLFQALTATVCGYWQWFVLFPRLYRGKTT